MSLKEKVEEARRGSAFVSWDVIDAVVEEIEKLKGVKKSRRKKGEESETP